MSALSWRCLPHGHVMPAPDNITCHGHCDGCQRTVPAVLWHRRLRWAYDTLRAVVAQRTAPLDLDAWPRSLLTNEGKALHPGIYYVDAVEAVNLLRAWEPELALESATAPQPTPNLLYGYRR